MTVKKGEAGEKSGESSDSGDCACAVKKTNKPVDPVAMKKKQEIHKQRAKESKERAAKLRQEADKLVAESIKAKETAQKSSFELIKKAKEATEAASQAEEEVKKMEADSQKCCGCVDQNCGPEKNIKVEIKILDETIERQRSLWSMVKIIKKQLIEA